MVYNQTYIGFYNSEQNSNQAVSYQELIGVDILLKYLNVP